MRFSLLLDEERSPPPAVSLAASPAADTVLSDSSLMLNAPHLVEHLLELKLEHGNPMGATLTGEHAEASFQAHQWRASQTAAPAGRRGLSARGQVHITSSSRES